ncbi:MAG: S41 family peptidase [Candidatus Paceibacterota bacterium]
MNDDNNTIQEDNMSGTKKNSVLGVTLALLLAIAAFFSGLQTERVLMANEQTASIFSIFARPEAKAKEAGVDLTEFWHVWGLLDERFIAASSTKVVTAEEKMYGAIRGLVGAYGDPYTVFLPPADSEAFSEDISGNFSGIGMEVGTRDGAISIIAPLKDTPADRAGLMAGDVIVKIDDNSTEGMSIDDAVRQIRGEKGTVVKLSIYREGKFELMDIEVTRDTISIPTVKTEQKDKTFIISLYSFNALAEAKMQEALREYVKSDADNILLDLRGNPGGYLQSAVAIASYFLPTGKVVVRERESEEGQEKLYRSQGKTLTGREPKKIVVLTDAGSASASEILAGALQEHGYATLIGTNTFGKGSVQELIPIDDGSSLKVTIARWFTPNGLSISDGGLTPDIVIKRTPEQRLEGIDPQLEAGLKFLQGEEVVSEVQ